MYPNIPLVGTELDSSIQPLSIIPLSHRGDAKGTIDQKCAPRGDGRVIQRSWNGQRANLAIQFAQNIPMRRAQQTGFCDCQEVGRASELRPFQSSHRIATNGNQSG